MQYFIAMYLTFFVSVQGILILKFVCMHTQIHIEQQTYRYIDIFNSLENINIIIRF